MNTKLVEAFRIHQSGDLGRAEELYRSMLGDETISMHVNQLLGALLLQKNQPVAAIPYLENATRAAPESATILNNLAIAYMRSQRPEAAVAIYRRSLTIEPNNIQTLKNVAELLIDLKRFQAAAEVLSHALKLNPNSVPLWMKYGVSLYRLEFYEEAKLCFDWILSQDPNDFKALLGLGRVLLRLSATSEETVAVWRKLSEVQPNNPLILSNCGTALTNMKQEYEAERLFRKSLDIAPDFLPAICNLGIVLSNLGRFEEARDCFLKAVSLESNCSTNCDSDEFGGVSVDYRRFDASVWRQYGCIAYSQLATVENLLGNLAAAEVAIERSLDIDPEHADSHLIRAFLLLQKGDYLNGWKEHEWRKRASSGPRKFSAPEWQGEFDPKMSVLIHAEQGLGDTLHFVRYAKLVKERVGKVIVLTYPRLIKLLQAIPEIDELATEVDGLPNFDRHVALMSLPHVLQTAMEFDRKAVPYLHASRELVNYWRTRLETIHGVRVGIVWQGNRDFSLDRDRSIPLRCFKPLSEISGVNLIALQNGDGREQLSEIDFQVMAFDGVDEAAGPFMDTAAMMMNLDLVIAPNTALLHLAGALGRPVWLAKSTCADWRWPETGGGSNPWYPTIRAFRQSVRGEWDSVFEEMHKELARLVALRGD